MVNQALEAVGLDTKVYGNTLGAWAVSALCFLASAIILLFVRRFLAARLRTLGGKPRLSFFSRFSQLVAQTSILTILILAAYLGTLVLTLSSGVEHRAFTVLTVAIMLQTGFWLSELSSWGLSAYTSLSSLGSANDSAGSSAMGLLSFLFKFVIWAVVSLLVLDNLGINITALVTGLGIGGVAVALAVQNILSDLLASLSIVLDKPFEIGDLIVVGESSGTVERIGIKTTRLRSITGEQLIFSNSELLKSRIRNYKRMHERRVLFEVSVVYDTSIEKLRALPEILKEIVSSQERIRFDRAHLKSLDASALIFEVVYFVSDNDYAVSMGIQEQINFGILERFAKEEVEFAYPTQSLILQRRSRG